MAEDETKPPQPSKKFPSLIVIGSAFAIIAVLAALLVMKQSPNINVEIPPAEYLVKERMFQLKDGSYLRLGFSIVIDSNKTDIVKQLLEKDSPGRLPAGITLALGNKTRKDLIEGTHKREAFARELKKILEERVFRDYNKKQKSVKDGIEIREVLISQFVTQEG